MLATKTLLASLADSAISLAVRISRLVAFSLFYLLFFVTYQKSFQRYRPIPGFAQTIQGILDTSDSPVEAGYFRFAAPSLRFHLDQNILELLVIEEAVEALRTAAREMGEAGIPASKVAKVVGHALTASRPKTRYVVGRDARIQSILRGFVPDRLRDRVVSRMMKLPK